MDYNIPGTQFIVSIFCGSLFEQKGLKIIHCPRTFDTVPEIVPTHSVFGQFLNKCDLPEIDVQIDRWIEMYANRGKEDISRAYRKRIFDEGELLPILSGNEVYCLAAFSKTNSIFNAESIELSDYIDYWNNLWRNLSSITVDREVINVAVPGDRLVNIATTGFPCEQKVAVIVNSFLQFIKTSGICKHLNICLYGKDGESFNYNGWKDTLFPFLCELSHLPLLWVVRKNYVHPPFNIIDTAETTMAPSIDNITSLFFSDLREMLSNIEKHLGEYYEQYEGSRKVLIKIDCNINALYRFVDSMENHDNLRGYFIHRCGTKYDKNRMFQLLGCLHECSSLFGSLNRRSVIKLALNTGSDSVGRWSYLGTNIDNIINYVGQRLSDFKKNHVNIYNDIRRTVPVELRKV